MNGKDEEEKVTEPMGKSPKGGKNSTKAMLDAEERVPVFIRRTPGDKRTHLVVMINDMNYAIAIDETVMVPKSIAELLDERHKAEKRGSKQLKEALDEIAKNPGGGVYR